MVKVETRKFIKVIMEMDLAEARVLYGVLGASPASDARYEIYVALGDALREARKTK